MFSLVYLGNNIFGVIDKKTVKFHKLTKKQFEVLVYSAREESVEIDGVTFKSDTTYTFKPVAFTESLNMFNALPYIRHVKVIESSPVDMYYSYLMELLSMSQLVNVNPSEALKAIGFLAYYSLKIEVSCRAEQKIINAILSSLAVSNNHIRDFLTTEPYPEDVMLKFHIEPEIIRKGKIKQ